MEVRVPDAFGAEAPHTGTTIIAVAFNGGVVLGADTRVTTGAWQTVDQFYYYYIVGI